jgi:hypothetical protein
MSSVGSFLKVREKAIKKVPSRAVSALPDFTVLFYCVIVLGDKIPHPLYH